MTRTPRCPVCRRRMSRAGETLIGNPVHACPWCLTVVAKGRLPIPQTPRWKQKARRAEVGD